MGKLRVGEGFLVRPREGEFTKVGDFLRPEFGLLEDVEREFLAEEMLLPMSQTIIWPVASPAMASQSTFVAPLSSTERQGPVGLDTNVPSAWRAEIRGLAPESDSVQKRPGWPELAHRAEHSGTISRLKRAAEASETEGISAVSRTTTGSTAGSAVNRAMIRNAEGRMPRG